MPHESKHVSKHALGVVAGAAIPAAVIGSLALAPAAQAAPVSFPKTSGSLAKAVTPESIKVAEDQIKAHLIASRISTLGLPAKRDVKEIKIPAGATLSSIAVEYHTSVAELKKLNGLKSDVIIAGKTLKVSGKSSSSKSDKDGSTKHSSAGTKTYTVKNGDTLSAIAGKHNMSLSSLLSKNDISASKVIYPGDKLKVNGSSSDSHDSGSKSTSKGSSSGSATYTVKSGDTLGSIAVKHNMSLSSLLSKNNISASKVIFPGDKLKINGSAKSNDSKSSDKKSSSSSTSSYTVKSGDTLSGIAAKHDMSLSELLKVNNISSSKRIYPGDKIKVSGGSSSSKSQTPSKPKAKTSTYTVKSGDTLGGIAAKHGMSLSELLKVNNISSSKRIYPGDKIKISGGSSSSKSQTPSKPKAKTSTYTVKSGDTLGGIAAKHDMSLKALLDLNPEFSASTPLKIGAKLKVSGSSVAPTGDVKQDKIGNTFEGRTYADHVVRDANANKNYLDSIDVPGRSEMQALVRSTAQSMGVDPALAMAHAYQESGFNMRAVSPANAVGVMQVLPSTSDWIASRIGQDLNVLNPRDNVVAGVAVIAYNLDNTDDLDTAIAAYYQGLAGVNKYGMYEDTKRYVASIKAHMKNYR
ncbi:LysM peptidoglycan-binding domain-containing protein [Glutamicibacter sp. JL.03c]|uniref:LysM peptidoglycan-binding domain-containing protein n=1 Tax=Glutamicibacter sp. JL.03c TaxID=2984842 RepID=UPI0021F7DFF9|nr:LysM peptidoglycan-binding domain-containing protein [Glutamicibacter sp. JL.03c]UYQ76384.1 LysM peptidoglycan-binding domain-containing protein [Glutamicibacter sp. JL.03c]